MEVESLDFDEFDEPEAGLEEEADDVTAIAEVGEEEVTGAPAAAAEADSPMSGIEDVTDLPELEEGDLEFTAHDEAEEEGEARMAEVNVLMAYGQFDRAAEFMQEALEEEPDNLGYHLKLLEIYSTMSDPVAFENAAKVLQEKTGGSGEQWKSAMNMWSDMNVGRELFSGGDEDTAGDLASTQRLSPELAQQIMQEDAEGAEEAGAAEEAEEIGGLDFPGAEEAPATGGDEDVDALVQELQAESGAQPTESVEEESLAADTATEELPSLDFDSGEDTEALPSLDLKSEGEGGAAEVMSLEGLEEEEAGEEESPGLDLEGLDIGEEADQEESLSLEGAEEETPALELEESGEEEKSDDLSLSLEDEDAETPALELEQDDKGGDEELSVEMTELPDSDDSGIELDLEIDSEPSVVSGTDTELNGDDTSTKLDLARAYMELGDNESARTSLEEVISEGDAAQRSEAEKLLSQLT